MKSRDRYSVCGAAPTVADSQTRERPSEELKELQDGKIKWAERLIQQRQEEARRLHEMGV